MTPSSAACVWCHEALSEEAIRFRLTIHPKCADERALAYVEAIATEGPTP